MDVPELRKMALVKARSQAQGDFLAWLLEEKGYVLAEYLPSAAELFPAAYNIEQLLAEYHGIDLDQVERERCALLQKPK